MMHLFGYILLQAAIKKQSPPFLTFVEGHTKKNLPFQSVRNIMEQ